VYSHLCLFPSISSAAACHPFYFPLRSLLSYLPPAAPPLPPFPVPTGLQLERRPFLAAVRSSTQRLPLFVFTARRKGKGGESEKKARLVLTSRDVAVNRRLESTDTKGTRRRHDPCTPGLSLYATFLQLPRSGIATKLPRPRVLRINHFPEPTLALHRRRSRALADRGHRCYRVRASLRSWHTLVPSLPCLYGAAATTPRKRLSAEASTRWLSSTRVPIVSPALQPGPPTPGLHFIATCFRWAEARALGYSRERLFQRKAGRWRVLPSTAVRAIRCLPALRVRARESCRGRRYNREDAGMLFHGRNIADVLDLTVTCSASRAHPSLSSSPRCRRSARYYLSRSAAPLRG